MAHLCVGLKQVLANFSDGSFLGASALLLSPDLMRYNSHYIRHMYRISESLSPFLSSHEYWTYTHAMPLPTYITSMNAILQHITFLVICKLL